MATARPFTYNNGPLISGSTQIGDLAIGSASLDYSSQPGGKVWWMGPDEDGKYIVAKDVPAQNYPTPVGNVGSVRFWATSGQTHNLFIGLTNNISGNSFSSTLTSWQWLYSNGYWTNFPTPQYAQERANFRIYHEKNELELYSANVIDYSPNQDTAYFCYVPTNNQWQNFGIAFYSNISSVSVGDLINVTGSSAYLPLVTNSNGKTRGMGNFTIDNTNNKLYVNAGDTVVKYDITNNTADGSVVTGGSNINIETKPAHVNAQSKLFLAEYDIIQIVDTSTMSYNSSNDIDVATDYSTQVCFAVADNDNDRVLCGGRGYFIIIDATNNNVIHSASLNGTTGDFLREPGHGVHVPSSNAYFVNGGVYASGSFNMIPYIIKIEDSSPYSQSIFSLDNRSNPNDPPINQYTSLAYDSTNNYIWAMNTERDICYLDLDTEIVHHTTVRFRGSDGAIAPTTTSNNGLFIGSDQNNNAVKMYDTNLVLNT